MDQESYETLTLSTDVVGDDREFLTDNMIVQAQQARRTAVRPAAPERSSSSPSRPPSPPSAATRPAAAPRRRATLETGLDIRVPLFIKEGEKVKVHTETREFAGRA